ncbi:MAG: hypothetical protein AB7O13_02985 [Alphaproteobacteria bacterium]
MRRKHDATVRDTKTKDDRFGRITKTAADRRYQTMDRCNIAVDYIPYRHKRMRRATGDYCRKARDLFWQRDFLLNIIGRKRLNLQIGWRKVGVRKGDAGDDKKADRRTRRERHETPAPAQQQSDVSGVSAYETEGAG